MSENALESEPPSPLIFASKVSGTPVFNTSGERVGHIDDVAIIKSTGEVAYAVLAAGGFLGMAERRYPIPWRILTYDARRNGYVAALDREQLRNAPSYEKADLADVGETWDQHWGPFI